VSSRWAEGVTRSQDAPAASAVVGAVEVLWGVVGGADNESDLRSQEAQVGPTVEAAARTKQQSPATTSVERPDERVSTAANGSQEDVSAPLSASRSGSLSALDRKGGSRIVRGRRSGRGDAACSAPGTTACCRSSRSAIRADGGGRSRRARRLPPRVCTAPRAPASSCPSHYSPRRVRPRGDMR
jgi:hypothetical protein